MRFSRTRRIKTPQIGSLELEILKYLWSEPAAVDARGVLANLGGRAISLSTVQGTLERLHRKRLLSRSKHGRAYLYTPAVSRERLISTLIGDLIDRVAEGELEPVISGFVDLIREADPALLEELETSAKQRKKDC
jgi:predicted transcriptional regulator